MDPPHNHLVRPYVFYVGLKGLGQMTSLAMAGAASFTIYTRTKEFFRDHHLIDHSKLLGSAAVGGIGGAMAGSLISFGSAREFSHNSLLFPFSQFGGWGWMAVSFRTRQGIRVFMALYVSTAADDERSQVRRQLEFTIAEKKGIKLVKPPSTASAIRDIFRMRGFFGLYTGFYLHFRKREHRRLTYKKQLT